MEELTWTKRREASFLNVLEASWLQASNDSTTRGMQLQPSSSQIPEFACIFRCSVAKAAAPAVCPALETMSGFSGDDTDSSRFAIEAQVNPKTIVPPWFQICMPFLTVVLLNEIDNFTIHLYTLFYSVHPIHTLE